MDILKDHALEIFTTILGLIYLYYEYKASILLWILGIIMPAIDVYLFATNGLYAYAGISIIFVIVAVYGFYNWRRGKDTDSSVEISFIKLKTVCAYALIMSLSFIVCCYVLTHLTDSEVPVMDSFTTAASFVGVFALAYKYVEQWIVWIVVDLISVILFVHQGLPFRAALYAFYVLVAIQGYRKWNKMAVTFQ